ncbi:MAG: cupin domain-containing protein [Mycolicibacterium sp.]
MTMNISRDGDRPAGPAPAENFTGEAIIKPLLAASEASNTVASEVTFHPSARNAWHSHPAGQALVITSGTGWVQEWGGPKQEVNAGDVVWTAAGVKHWHGATDAETMTHIAIQDSVEGTTVDWFDKVDDEDYLR